MYFGVAILCRVDDESCFMESVKRPVFGWTIIYNSLQEMYKLCCQHFLNEIVTGFAVKQPGLGYMRIFW